ncbi:hypothetical protein GCM10020256_58050 [Streptomyces thermocoprophilus]
MHRTSWYGTRARRSSPPQRGVRTAGVGLAQQLVRGPAQGEGEDDRAADDDQRAEQILHATEPNRRARGTNV